ncbi:MAG: hypothetical protein MUF62_14400, partial [Chitinophagaceae bacterium]|nr:hypothetical protein [Chitinophagaceae bacterium]
MIFLYRRRPHLPSPFPQNYISTTTAFSLGAEKINPADDAKALLAQPNALHCCTCKVAGAFLLVGARLQVLKECKGCPFRSVATPADQGNTRAFCYAGIFAYHTANQHPCFLLRRHLRLPYRQPVCGLPAAPYF